MRKHAGSSFWPIALVAIGLVCGCSNGGGGRRTPRVTDTVAPTVVLVTPVNLATGRPADSQLTVRFSEAMDVATIVDPANFTLRQGGTPVAGSIGYSGNTATFTPFVDLMTGTRYDAMITDGVADLAGNALADGYSWSFTTGGIDVSRPSVILTGPRDLAVSEPLDRTVMATFSEAMDPLTITDLSFTMIQQGGAPVIGQVAYAGGTATFTPVIDLLANTLYTATISTMVTDLGGNTLLNPHVFSFTTGDELAGSAAVPLGELAHFAVLGGYAVTNIPSSDIEGDLGVSPSAGSFITGFAQVDAIGFAISPQVTGLVYAADMAEPTPTMLTRAKGDLTIAYQDAAGRTPIPTGSFLNPGAGNLAGLNLAPGLYKFTSSAIATTGFTLTGGPDDVWIFQIATNLNVSSGVHVVLAGGASARNVFWQVGTEATLGTGSAFQGTLLADVAITMETGATLVGRALAFTGTIALDQNSITLP